MIKIPKNQTDLMMAGATGFVTGLLVALLLLIQFRQTIIPWIIDYEATRPIASKQERKHAPQKGEKGFFRGQQPPPVQPETPPVEKADFLPVNPADVYTLRSRNLIFPLPGSAKTNLRDTFNAPRGTSRRHEGIDLIAPRNTPIHAVDDGTIAKLWSSKPGGITLYQFDPTKEYTYYYAHLERYESGLKEGDQIRRGQVIGYVGTSGNAPKDTPHLHFAIYKLTESKKWYEGTAVNPYQVYSRRG